MMLMSSISLIVSGLYITLSLAAPSIDIHAKPDTLHHHHFNRDAHDRPSYVIGQWSRTVPRETIPGTVEARNRKTDDPWAALDGAARAVVRNTAGKSPMLDIVKRTEEKVVEDY